ncbi:MAG: malto-oligosyltrehalose synthase [Bryobacteraceae bacterium]
MRIPISTYRLQFGCKLGFRQARELIPYLHRLGISDVYASPIFKTHTDAASGYDIVDPTSLNPTLGSWEEFLALAKELKRHEMGLLLDIVPNHMSANASNFWWKDVLENGPSSPYANYFDIEWDPPSRSRGGKMLWPILGAPYGEVLERRELTLAFSEDGFAVRYFDRTLPIEPTTYAAILSHIEEAGELVELARSIPPSDTINADSAHHRRTVTRQVKRQLYDLYTSDGHFRSLLDNCIRAFNGEPGDPRSFDLLDDLLMQQPYVLSFWRVAREKVNYRRFFDIADLVGVNVEEAEVFATTHCLIFQLVDEGWVTGLRIDHIDGLYDPAEYLRRLRERLPDCFLVVEKILEQPENLEPQWPVAGTTGYDFINAMDSVMVDSSGVERLTAGYRQLTGREADFADVAYEQRKRIIEWLFGGEAHSLSLHLNLLAEADRYAKDASPQELHAVLMEVTACLPVYRTYTRSFQILPQDALHIDQAFREARRRNPHWSETVWSFVRRVLLLECPPNLSAEQRAGWKQFVQRWQQFSAPVMAKGKEDTAFYVHSCLISMNEVGGQDQPWRLEDFHRFEETRARSSPHTLNAGTTHDTKRGEDVRARIQALSGIPELWIRRVKRWQHWNARCKRAVNGVSVPDANEEYFIYQTLVGAWPLCPHEAETFEKRLQDALLKSWRESKLYTSWSNPDQAYESAVAEFVTTILSPVEENRFLPDFLRFQQRIAAGGACISLAQTLVRLVSPGVPDIYNGAELWELSLVDPDNRRPVDFGRRQALLASLDDNAPSADLLKHWQSGSIKQSMIQRTLKFRRDHADVFQYGEYIPLDAHGKHATAVVAFARHFGMAWVIAIAPRVPAIGLKSALPAIDGASVADMDLAFPATAPRRWSNLFTGASLEVPGSGRLPLAGMLRRFPVALLTALPD